MMSSSGKSVSRESTQHPSIKIRYTTKQLLTIYKSLGRFQHPLDSPTTYHLAEVECLRPLMNSKPYVVLQHLKSSSALPLVVG